LPPVVVDRTWEYEMRIEDKARAGERVEAASQAVDNVAVDQTVIDKIAKLFKLAESPNQAEATAAMNKAQALLAQYNLSEMAVTEGASSAKAAKRTDEKHRGGLYKFQRDLWQSVAELNFCWYFASKIRDPNKISQYWIRKYGGKANVPEWRRGGHTPAHRLVGRAVNVAATLAMVQYLEATIERLVRERIQTRVVEKARTEADRAERWGRDPNPVQEDPLWGEWAVKYREGIVDTVTDKIWDRRQEMLKGDEFKKYKATEDGRAGAQTGTALTLMDVKEQEYAANYDFLYGEGAYAKVLSARAVAAAERAEREARYAAWAAANPEEAKKEEEKRRKSARRTSWNAGTARDKTDHGAYWDGRDAGEKVSIDQQVSSGKAGLLK
jgi:hypothetical protein